MPIVLECRICGKNYKRDPGVAAQSSYCSRACQGASKRTLTDTTCVLCGVAFRKRKHWQTACSNRCAQQNRRACTGVLATFWDNVDRSGGPEACWPWMRAVGGKGYGNVPDGVGRTLRSSRVAWELTHGPIADGLFVLHRCDNRPCCNPAHLFLGTAGDNIRDCVAKGRHRNRYSPPKSDVA